MTPITVYRSFDMLGGGRLEIIAAIDAEIEGLEYPRLLIAQSAVDKVSNPLLQSGFVVRTWLAELVNR